MIINSKGVSGILMIDGEVLLIHRAPHETEQAWEFPKGAVEPNEELVDAIVREFQEETGLLVTAKNPLGDFRWQYKKEGNTHYIDETIFLVNLLGDQNKQDVRLSDDHDDYKWAALAEIEKMEPMVPQRKKFLREFLLDSN